MTAAEKEFRTFKRSMIVSAAVHLLLFIFLLLSPHLPSPSSKGMTHYVNIISFGGGGGSGGGGGGGGLPGGGGGGETEEISDTPVTPRESLDELTTPPNLQQTQAEFLRYPVEKPEREKKTQPKKKTTIRKQEKTAAKTPSQSKKASGESGSGGGSGGGAGGGSGLRLGVGSGGGYGFGSEYASQIGLSTFPYTYYLQQIHARISNNWFTSRITTGITGNYFTSIKFRIFQDGHISEPEILESSQIRSLDLSALRAIRSAAPFPPLPSEYEDEYLIIRLIFEHGQ
jgi:TonB family protein